MGIFDIRKTIVKNKYKILIGIFPIIPISYFVYGILFKLYADNSINQDFFAKKIILFILIFAWWLYGIIEYFKIKNKISFLQISNILFILSLVLYILKFYDLVVFLSKNQDIIGFLFLLFVIPLCACIPFILCSIYYIRMQIKKNAEISLLLKLLVFLNFILLLFILGYVLLFDIIFVFFR